MMLRIRILYDPDPTAPRVAITRHLRPGSWFQYDDGHFVMDELMGDATEEFEGVVGVTIEAIDEMGWVS